MAIGKRLRFEILRRDNHQCRYCGAKPPHALLRVDHVIPEALGGPTEPSNLVAACEPCNNGKGSLAPGSPLVEDVKRDALRWARAMEIAIEAHRLKREERDAYVGYFTALWNDWTHGPAANRQKLPLADDWHSTIEKFFDLGLEADDLAYAVRTAMEHKKVTPENTYRYFCGICWNTLKELREAAADIVMDQIDYEISSGR